MLRLSPDDLESAVIPGVIESHGANMVRLHPFLRTSLVSAGIRDMVLRKSTLWIIPYPIVMRQR